MTRELLLHGNRVPFRLESASGGAVVLLEQSRHELTLQELGSGRLVIGNASAQWPARAVRDRDRIWVWLAGKTFEFQLAGGDHGTEEHRAEADRDVRAPMPGTLVKLFVGCGDSVEKGQVVAVVEAMKMEHPLRAPRDGEVAAVSGSVGATVDAGEIIVSLVSKE